MPLAVGSDASRNGSETASAELRCSSAISFFVGPGVHGGGREGGEGAHALCVRSMTDPVFFWHIQVVYKL